jgi:hypothetical protein
MSSSSVTWIKKNIDFTVLSVTILISILYALQLKGWTQPYISDRTFHLYSSQMIAKGAIPYVDFFNVHPPAGIMLTALPMYLFPSLQVGVGPALVHSVLTMIWSFCATISLYFIAKRITSTWVGGLLCVTFWMYLTPLFVRHYSIGQNRLLVISCILITIALLQGKRWYWAGFSLAMGFMTYYPAALAGVAVLFVIAGQKTWQERIKASALFLAGFITLSGIILLWLSEKGALGAWFDVTLRWPFAFGEVASSNVKRSLSKFLINSNISIKNIIINGYKFWDVNLLWIPIGGVIGYFYFTLKQIISKNKKITALLFSDKIAPVFLTTLMFYFYLLVEKGPLDPLLLESLLTVWISFLLIEVTSFVKSYSVVGYSCSFIIISITLSFFSYKLFATMNTLFQETMHPMWRDWHLEYSNSTYLQTKASQEIVKTYSADKNILVLGDLWFLNASNRKNASNFYHTGGKMMLAAQLSGNIDKKENLWHKLADLNSDLVLVTKYRHGAFYNIMTEKLVEMEYACVGEASDVLVIMPRKDVQYLPSIFKMQQVFTPPQSADDFDEFEIIAPDDLNKLSNRQISEIVPGTLLLGYQTDKANANLVTLYWWNWLDPEDQVFDIFMETKYNGRIVSSQLLNKMRFPRNQVIRQVVELPDFQESIENGQLIISHHEEKITRILCKSDFTRGPVTIPLLQ